MAAPPSPGVIPPIVGLLVRVITFFLLLISMIVLCTSKVKLSVEYSSEDSEGYTSNYILSVSKRFNLFFAYRYLISCIVLGMAYSIVQIGCSVIHVTSGKRVAEFLEKIDFYPDFFLSSLLISGAAASFGLSVDLKRADLIYELDDKFFEKIYASTSLCLIAFVFASITTIISHLNATRKSVTLPESK